MMEIDKILPQELWIKVLEFVSMKDLCSVAAVCSHLHHVVSDPSLWSNSKINKQKLKSGCQDVFLCPRYQSLKSLDLLGVKLVSISCCSSIFAHLENPTSHLTEVSFEGVTFSNVPAYILADIVSHLHKVSFASTNLSFAQCTAVLSSIAHHKSSRITDLNLEMVDLSCIPSDLLSASVILVTSVNLRRTGLTPSQVISLYQAIISSSSKILENLNLRFICLSSVPSHLLAEATCGLTSAVLGFTKLTQTQATAILTFIQQNPISSRCKDINFCRVNLSSIETNLLASSLTRLKKINLRWTKLSEEQSSCLVSHSLSSTTLTDLNLSNVSLSHISPDSLAKAVVRLEVAKLWWTNLTTIQVTAILQHNLLTNTLQCLELQGVDCEKVDPEILGNSIAGLRTANLERTRLTTEQCTQIFKRSLTSKTMKEINLCCINLNYVDKILLVQALGKHVILI